jgi:hypothetical protein
MDCREIRLKLGLLLSGELTERESETVRQHLDVCPDCIDYLLISGKLDLLAEQDSGELPRDFADRVVTATNRHPRRSAPSRMLIWIFTAAAALAITAYAYLRYYFTPGDFSELPGRPGESAMSGLMPIAAGWLSSPVPRYLLLTVLSLLISAVLVYGVDWARQQSAARRQSAR